MLIHCFASPDLLHTVAKYADVNSISILTASRHLKFHYDQSAIPIASALEKIQQRVDKSSELIAAFADLVAVIQAEPADDSPDESLMEAGLLESPASSWHSLEFTGMLQYDHSYEGSSSSETFEDAEESFSLRAGPISQIVDFAAQ